MKHWLESWEWSFQLDSGIVPLLDESLSHVEVSSRGKRLVVVQRNIYSGAVSSITKQAKGLLSGQQPPPFDPIGIRTNDLLALFQFCGALKFYRPSEGDYFGIEGIGGKTPMRAILSHCLYDEIADVSPSREDG